MIYLIIVYLLLHITPLLTASHYTWSAARRNAISILLLHQKPLQIWLSSLDAKTVGYPTYSSHHTRQSPYKVDAGWHHICPTKMDVHLEAAGCTCRHPWQLFHPRSWDSYHSSSSSWNDMDCALAINVSTRRLILTCGLITVIKWLLAKNCSAVIFSAQGSTGFSFFSGTAISPLQSSAGFSFRSSTARFSTSKQCWIHFLPLHCSNLFSKAVLNPFSFLPLP